MQKKMFCWLGVWVGLYYGFCVNSWSGQSFYRIDSTQNKPILDSPQEEVVVTKTNYSIPRNQVLLEIATGTW